MPALIGYDMCHYAKMLTDDAVSKKATYEVPIRVTGAMTANINPNSSEETLFGDNGPMESASALGKIDLELGCVDFPLDIQADMLGHEINGGMLIRKSSDSAPYMAVGGRSLKSNGKYRYFWLVKGKMSEPEHKKETKKDKVEYQTPTLKGSFLKRDCDDIWIIEYDEDLPGADPEIIKNWFSKVMGPDDLPLSFTSNPKNGAVGIETGASVVLQFSKELTSDVVTSTNITMKAKAGTAVTCSVTLGADKKTVTIKPNAALTASTEYVVTVKTAVGVKADTEVSFTTA